MTEIGRRGGTCDTGCCEHSDIAAVGDASGLAGDVEGLALYRAPGRGTAGYLVASSQGIDRFKVYRLKKKAQLILQLAAEAWMERNPRP